MVGDFFVFVFGFGSSLVCLWGLGLGWGIFCSLWRLSGFGG